MAGEIPRLFQVRTGAGVGDVLGDGVLWPDGTVSVRWSTGAGPTQGWPTLASAGVTLELGGHTVVWLRQDTYADPQPADDQTTDQEV
jgi:hypothetical protein